MAAGRAGDTLVVGEHYRLDRSPPDGRDIADKLAATSVSVSLGGRPCDPADPVGRLLFDVLRMATRARGRLRGKRPNRSAVERQHALPLHDAGEQTRAERAEPFGVSRTTVDREI